MSYTAPKPEQFASMEEAYGIMAPTAAALITMPAFVFRGPVMKISKLIFMSQCNPGKIMRISAVWLQLAERYIGAAEKLKEEIDNLEEGDWDADDREAFNEKSEKVMAQLNTIGAYAMITGISLMTIATMLAVMVPLMLTVATVLQALVPVFFALRAIPPPAGLIAVATFRLSVMSVASSMLGVLESLDKAIDIAADTLAGVMAANMTASWIALASKGNVVNPVDTIGSTGFSMLQGLAQLGMRNAAGIGGPITAGFSGGQSIYNIGNTADGIQNPDKDDNPMIDAGIDVGNLDFVPNNNGFEDAARGAGGGDNPAAPFDQSDEDKEKMRENLGLEN